MNAAVHCCPVCGATAIASSSVLWPELIDAWELSPPEAAYIERQQGTACTHCGNNLRAMALAAAVVRSFGLSGTLARAIESPILAGLEVLEINAAGNLTPFLAGLRGHRLVSFPEFDMCALDLPGEAFDLIVHSDTLEHVPDPVRALTECRRLLRPGGRCIFTIPIVLGRLNRSRAGLPPSYHGAAATRENDQLVHTEFGADCWVTALQGGFSWLAIHCLEYPAALALEARP